MSRILIYIGSVLSSYFRIWFRILIALLLIALVVYLAVLIPHNKLAESHIKNVKMIEWGMSPNEVILIMGNSGLYKNTWGKDSVYSYEAGMFASSNIEIIFNDSMRVKTVVVPEGVISPVTGKSLGK